LRLRPRHGAQTPEKLHPGGWRVIENKGKAKHREAEKKRKNTKKVKDYIVTDYC
jgi:hypothetical protein